MAITSTPVNPHNNTSPVRLTTDNFADPFDLAAAVATQAGLPQEVLDKVHTDCSALVRDNWMAFLDMFQMNIGFETDYIQFIESTSPDYVIDDTGAVSRTANVFTIDWTAVEGWETGEAGFFYRVDDTIAVYDTTGKFEMGVITAIDKANNQFTAVCRNGLNWTVATTNLTIDVNGSDFDKASCGPEGLMELRKTKSVILKLQTVKDAMQSAGGVRYAFCLDSGEVKWYDDNNMELTKRLNRKVAKTLLREIESVDGSGAYLAGKFGTKGLFQNLKENSLVFTGYIQTVADLEAITTYWDSLGLSGKEMLGFVNNTQFRYLEKLAVLLVKNLGLDVGVDICCLNNDLTKIGFISLQKDGYIINFSKWGLTEGNSVYGKTSVTMPKGVFMPSGTVKTKINGVDRQVPYIFKGYQDKANMGKPGVVRTYLTGGFAGGNGSDCEYLKISKSTTVGLAVVCPEALVIII